MSFEIIPNWHPFLVHFTIALLMVGTVLYLLSFIKNASWQAGAFTAARWMLWIGAGMTGLTLLAGWQAFQTVVHDGPSHITMLSHRLYAFITAGLMVVALALMVVPFNEPDAAAEVKAPSPLVAVVLVVMAVMLAVTGLKGAELVYRHGLGVQSLPKSGAHSHGDNAGHAHEDGDKQGAAAPEAHKHEAGKTHDHGGHSHDGDTHEGHDHSHDEGHKH